MEPPPKPLWPKVDCPKPGDEPNVAPPPNAGLPPNVGVEPKPEVVDVAAGLPKILPLLEPNAGFAASVLPNGFAVCACPKPLPNPVLVAVVVPTFNDPKLNALSPPPAGLLKPKAVFVLGTFAAALAKLNVDAAEPKAGVEVAAAPNAKVLGAGLPKPVGVPPKILPEVDAGVPNIEPEPNAGCCAGLVLPKAVGAVLAKTGAEPNTLVVVVAAAAAPKTGVF